MRPTGALHLGHFHGVLKSWLALQQAHECFFFVADWHALTNNSLLDHDTAVYDMVVDWLAAGIDPGKATLFLQSRMPEHAELFTLLAMHTPLAWLERVPGFKEQADQHPSYGLLGYPLLQAADILAYKGECVPVGQDQAAHLELAREVARSFNHRAGRALFPMPQAHFSDAPRMPGLDGRKMSKSLANTIGMREPPESVHTKLRAMPTDPQRVHRHDAGEPTACPVWALHEVITPTGQHAQLQQDCRTAAMGCLDCKQVLGEHITAEQAPWRERAAVFEAEPKQVQWLVEVGCERARALARKTLREVREVLSFGAGG